MVTLSRIIKYGFQNFFRNALPSISTVSVMILAGLVFEYVSRDEALENFKEQHADDPTVLQTLDELDENPLLASLNVKAKELNQYGAIAEYLEAPVLSDVVEKVTYAQNKIVIDRLISISRTLERGALLLTIFLALLAITITFNTIRLAIFSNSEQIEIMRLVGASNSFIRGPYIVEGIVYGAVAALIGFLILIPVINFASPHLANFILEVDLAGYFVSNWLRIFLYELLFGAALGVVSSVFAIRKYLKI